MPTALRGHAEPAGANMPTPSGGHATQRSGVLGVRTLLRSVANKDGSAMKRVRVGNGCGFWGDNLDARPIADALRQGAAVVVTGRVADAALTLGPAAHELGWAWDDWDRLCAGTVAGHLIECGAQATGGLWCNWQESGHLAGVGYPVAELEASGAFVLTKPEGSGGAVNLETAAEQLLYEVEDPAAYYTPDVVADFTSVTLADVGPDAVGVTGAAGLPATDTYKVSVAYRDGYTSSGTLVVLGPGAPEKARKCGRIILD